VEGDPRILNTSSFNRVSDNDNLQSRDVLLTLREMKAELVEIRQAVAFIAEVVNSVSIEIVKPQYPTTEENDGVELPEDLPARDVLIAAGVMKVSEIPRTAKSLRAIEGVRDEDVVPLLRYIAPKEKR